MKINNTELVVAKGNIACVRADAVVSFVDNKPVKSGSAICDKVRNPHIKYIIYAAAMKKGLNTDEVIIRSAVNNSLQLAKRLRLKSIAFPALSCSRNGFPVKATAKIMAQEVLRHAKYDKSSLKKISFVLYDKPTYDIFNKIVVSYLEYIQYKLSQGPFITVDIIIKLKNGVVLIERSNPPFGWAIPGGFVDYGETLEHCARREAKEETGLDIYDLKQMHTYSQPRRDPRFHTVTTVFTAKAKGRPRAGDDAQNIKVVALKDISKLKLAFDHNDVFKDYKKLRRGE
ncbi:MAG: NUDIX domain-containing protein [Candidatus Omnitrophica bacterium]|nr:NUDIX domain-containing protein [Candidatus Omnitrophota bacterium]